MGATYLVSWTQLEVAAGRASTAASKAWTTATEHAQALSKVRQFHAWRGLRDPPTSDSLARAEAALEEHSAAKAQAAEAEYTQARAELDALLRRWDEEKEVRKIVYAKDLDEAEKQAKIPWRVPLQDDGRYEDEDEPTSMEELFGRRG